MESVQQYLSLRKALEIKKISRGLLSHAIETGKVRTLRTGINRVKVYGPDVDRLMTGDTEAPASHAA